MAKIKCVVVTPEATAIESEAAFVVVPLYDGEFGVGLNHGPMIGRLGYGELRLRTDSGQVERYYVDGGFVQVADNVVTVLTGRVVAAAKLDTSAAEKMLKDAMKRSAATDELLQQRDRAIEQARSQLRLAQKA